MKRWFWWLIHLGKMHEKHELEWLRPLGVDPPEFYFDLFACKRCGRRFVRPGPL